jgi:methionyl-tRNA formyltransferase
VTEAIGATDTTGDLLARLAASGADLLVRTIDGIAEGTLGAVPQPDIGVSFAPRLTVQDGRVRWPGPALHIDRQVRASTPSPGAWTTFRGDRLRVYPLHLEADQATIKPGQLVVSKDSVLVGTGSYAVRLDRVQPQGKRAMSAADWARGIRVGSDELLV